MSVPPTKSMPKFRPWKKNNAIAAIDSNADTGKLMRRKRMKSNLVSSGTMRSRRTVVLVLRLQCRLDRHDLGALPLHPRRHDQTRQREGREQAGGNADSE